MKFLLSGASLYPMPQKMILDMAKKAGFDGAELFLFGSWNTNKVEKILVHAERLGLEVHFHQTWSKEESSDAAAATANKILRMLGQIPKDGYELQDVIPDLARPVVIYANYVDQIRSGMWVQTLSTGFGSPRMRYPDFKEKYREKEFPIVFDTTHVLEYSSGMHGVSSITHVNLLNKLMLLLDDFSLGSVKEIHFNDCDPKLGDKHGRNVMTGNGIMFVTLKEFGSILMEKNWDGYIVPEVRPDLIKWDAHRLLELRKGMDYFFK